MTRLSAENRFTRPIISRFTKLTSSLVRDLFLPLSDGFSLVDCSRRFVHILLPTWHYPIGLPLCLYTERVHTRGTYDESYLSLSISSPSKTSHFAFDFASLSLVSFRSRSRLRPRRPHPTRLCQNIFSLHTSTGLSSQLPYCAQG